MAYEISRHPLVKNDLLAITIFVGDYAGYDVAEEKISEIEICLRSLREFPNIGTMRNEICDGLRVTTAVGKAVVCFVVDEERKAVDVICITYAGADWQARVRQRRR